MTITKSRHVNDHSREDCEAINVCLIFDFKFYLLCKLSKSYRHSAIIKTRINIIHLHD